MVWMALRGEANAVSASGFTSSLAVATLMPVNRVREVALPKVTAPPSPIALKVPASSPSMSPGITVTPLVARNGTAAPEA